MKFVAKARWKAESSALCVDLCFDSVYSGCCRKFHARYILDRFPIIFFQLEKRNLEMISGTLARKAGNSYVTHTYLQMDLLMC